MKKITYAAEPVVSRAISPKKVADLSKLGDVVRTWIMADPTASYNLDDKTKKIVLEGIDPLQIEILITRIDEQITVDISDPVIVHRETIGGESDEFMTKSNNGHNRVALKARLLPAGVVKALREGKIDQFMGQKRNRRCIRKCS